MEVEDIFDWLKLTAAKVNFWIIMNKVMNNHIINGQKLLHLVRDHQVIRKLSPSYCK